MPERRRRWEAIGFTLVVAVVVLLVWTLLLAVLTLP